MGEGRRSTAYKNGAAHFCARSIFIRDSPIFSDFVLCRCTISAGVALFVEPLFLEEFDHGVADVGDGFGDRDARGVECGDFIRSGALAAGDDGACMSHAFAGRRLTPCDEGGNGFFGHVFPDPFRGFFFGGAADLADEEDGECVGVCLKEFQDVDEVHVLDGVAADADGGCLSDAGVRELERRLIGEGAGARDEPDMSGLCDAGRGDAEFCLIRRQESRAVGAEEAGLFALHVAAHLDHVEDGDVLGDADDQRELCVDGFHDGVGGKTRGDVDDGGVRAGCLNGISDGVVDGDALDDLSRLPRGDARDDLRAGIEHLPRMEEGGFARDALHDGFGIFINQNGHS